MTGPEHYAEAERYLTDGYIGEGAEIFALKAQVHATLALAAAVALGAPAGSNEEWVGMPDATAAAWCRVAGES